MGLAGIEILLKKAMGLDARSIGSNTLERAVRQRAAACGLRDWRDYAGHVQTSTGELQELIEAVVVPETWFFRDRAAFTALARLVQAPEFRSRPLRLLSVPCSTGEEPYSLAMTLFDAGLTPERFHIQAVDISSHALSRARRAVFGKNSFRGAPLDFRERHFRPGKDGYCLKPEVQRQVSFAPGNLLRGSFGKARGPFDFIFCRNVLIYFDPPTQQRVLGLLLGLLDEQGVLFVGPAESGLVPAAGFISAKLPKAFAFRKDRAASPRLAPGGAEPERRSSGLQNASGPTPVQSHGTKTRFLTKLDLARRLADRGQLQEAAGLCEDWLAAHPDSADAWYLLGLVRDARGELAVAGELYRKSLYLDPDHAEALAHLALLSDKLGDCQSARLLQDRVRRVQRKLQP